MSNTLVAYFSASAGRRTAKMAEALAGAIDADLYEITPEVPYTKKDLNWMNPLSRTTKEMHNKSFRPPIAGEAIDMAGYDTIFLGFPIWWYIAPTIINTFLEAHNFEGKKIVLFATSGGSGFGKTASKLEPSAPKAIFCEGNVNGSLTPADLKAWAEEYL